MNYVVTAIGDNDRAYFSSATEAEAVEAFRKFIDSRRYHTVDIRRKDIEKSILKWTLCTWADDFAGVYTRLGLDGWVC